MREKFTISNLKDEIRQYRKTYPALKDDSAFVLWFVRAYLEDREEASKAAITGESGDKNIDAVLINERAKQAHIVQGKFRETLGECSENRNDVPEFAGLATYPWQTKAFLEEFYSHLAASVHEKLENIVHHARHNGYEIRLYYVTTGKCSKHILNAANQVVSEAEGPARIYIFDAPQVMTIYGKYAVGEAPAVPELTLRVSSEGAVRSEGVIQRFDSRKEIESWVFSMLSADVGEMYAKAGLRLFARNIRGYLGKTNEINEAMATTIKNEPENFWYYNNGVTIVCDTAKREIQGGQDVLIVERPQVINGQQTTRTLRDNSSSHASVLVKVIRIPRRDGDEDEYDDLVSSIVRATNWQNYITPSDLVSNDAIQVYLERELRKRGYRYVRKRQTSSEAKALGGGALDFEVKKEQLAQAVAGCEFDPSVLLKGKEALFDERYYRSIFHSRSIRFYLSRYWLMRRVVVMSKKNRQRAYAKWFVLRLLWDLLSSDLSNSAARRFRYACEMYYQSWEAYKAVRKLEVAIEKSFAAALAFYSLERGTGREALDRQSFFKQSNRFGRFLKYWQSSKNQRRKPVNEMLRRFVRVLNELDVED